MKRAIFAAATLTFVFVSGIFGQDASVVYTAGYVDLKEKDGEIYEALIGDALYVGDSVITGEDGTAELDQQNTGIIKISPDTVFSVREIERNGEKRTVLSTAIGKVRFAFDRATGNEPLLASPGAVAGVRGTEVELLAGADGSTLIVVETGAVEVESRGETVSLAAEEGVEVAPGRPPGEKFTVLRGQLDFSAWSAEKTAAIDADPLAALENAAEGLEALMSEIEALVPMYERKRSELSDERKELLSIKDEEKRKRFYEDTVFPLEIQTTYTGLNLRYYTLSALSYRRFVIGGIYLRVTSSRIGESGGPDETAFLKRYGSIIDRYERIVSPHLVERDI